ncbi:nucleotide-binding universal stress UspA family protein [Pseudonocardia hierapolitana]|uniref:Nucleotide-binding universal stress UspA family protein n=1 Tax=Pseudonocardia hierapolitana TaxID=1128676 RepID=A0A561SJV6_9PSEU|nr:universal stress protein [Pseudonocardia hierapolitana]TWF75123.1 nucleotide-binding universal stress UspA family protein [Pseudonocardia hierapolitana]
MDAYSGRAVVVGIDGSEIALRAVRWAAAAAARSRVPLRVVTAFDWTRNHPIGEINLGASYRDIMLNEARRNLADAAAAAERAAEGIEVEQQLVVGFPIAVLTAESEHAQLVVIGDRGLGGVTGLLLGSVAAGLAAQSKSPVVVVRGDEDTDPAGPIVVGVDGTPLSEAALAYAYEAAAARGVHLVAVHSWRGLIGDLDVAPLLDWDGIETEEREALSERLAGWGEKYPDVPVRRVVTKDRPAHALVEQSRHAQLVVVGSRGRGSFTGLVLGSVSHAVLHRSHCPVAVVRAVAGSEG